MRTRREMPKAPPHEGTQVRYPPASYQTSSRLLSFRLAGVKLTGVGICSPGDPSQRNRPPGARNDRRAHRLRSTVVPTRSQ